MPATAARAGRIYRARPIAIEILIAAEGFGNVSFEIQRVESLDDGGRWWKDEAEARMQSIGGRASRGRTRKHGQLRATARWKTDLDAK
jgi:hypothetical protein